MSGAASFASGTSLWALTQVASGDCKIDTPTSEGCTGFSSSTSSSTGLCISTGVVASSCGDDGQAMESGSIVEGRSKWAK